MELPLTPSEALNVTASEMLSLYKRFVSSSQVELLSVFGPGRVRVERAEGCYIYTEEGRKVLDLTGGIGVLGLGHNHPEILRRRSEYASKSLMEVHKNFISPLTAVLAANVASMMPGDLSKSYFPNSGAEAVEGAVKMAYKFHDGRRKWILHSNISFHGKLLGAGSLMGSPEVSFDFPKIPFVDSFVYDDEESVVAACDRHKKEDGSSDVYAIIVEPLSASTMRSLRPEFISWLRDWCDRHNIVLIFDEVYTGWGRTGDLFNFMRVEGVCPDIVTYAKTFGGGKASISGYTASGRVADRAYGSLQDATLHSTTYFGFGEEAYTAITALEIIRRDKLVERAREIEASVRPFFETLAQGSSLVSEVRGAGTLWGIILDSHWIGSMVEKIGSVVPYGPFRDKRFSEKLLIGSLINHLYEEHGILSYFGSNVEYPLVISFPMIAGNGELEWAKNAITETFSSALTPKVLDFVKMRASRPRV